MLLPNKLSKRVIYPGYYSNSGWYNYRWALLALLIVPIILVVVLLLRRKRRNSPVYPVYGNNNQTYYQSNQQYKQQTNTGIYQMAPQPYGQQASYVPPPNPPTGELPAYDSSTAPNGGNYGPSTGTSDGNVNYDNYAPPAGPPPSHVKL